MFKKSLIALALVAASSTAFAAADITATNETDVSIEGSASLDNVEAAQIDVELGAEYSVGDIITFTFSGGIIDDATIETTISVDMATNINVTDVMTLGFLSSTDTSLTYRVTELDTSVGGTTVQAIVNVGATTTLEFDRDSVIAAGDIDVTFAAETSTGIAIDTGTTSSTDLFTTTSQFVVTVAAADMFDAVIDVEQQRLQFDDTDVVDDLVFDIDTDAGLTYPVAAGDVLVDVVLTGDFSYLDTDTDTAGIQLHANSSVELTGSNTTDGSATLTATTATWTDIQVIASDTLTIEIDSTGATNLFSAEVIPTQDFTLDLDIKYDDFGATLAGGGAQGSDNSMVTEAAGEWTLNGSVIEVPFMPFGPVTQPILRHTNVGAQTGDITLRYMVEGVDIEYTDSVVLIEQAAPGVRNLLTEITAALLADGYDASVSGFKVALEITTNVPAEDVKVTAAAKFTSSDTDRLTIGVMSSNQ